MDLQKNAAVSDQECSCSGFQLDYNNSTIQDTIRSSKWAIPFSAPCPTEMTRFVAPEDHKHSQSSVGFSGVGVPFWD